MSMCCVNVYVCNVVRRRRRRTIPHHVPGPTPRNERMMGIGNEEFCYIAHRSVGGDGAAILLLLTFAA